MSHRLAKEVFSLRGYLLIVVLYFSTSAIMQIIV